MFDDFKALMQRELEKLKSKASEAGRCEREHLANSPSSLTIATSAPCLGGPSCKIPDPTSVDKNIVKVFDSHSHPFPKKPDPT